MKDECIFCKIITGEVESYTLYENASVKVFLDAYPIAKGHCLYVPKKHYRNIQEIPANEMEFTKNLPEIVEKIKKVTKATGINIWQNNGRDAGQFVPHVHFHIVPRYGEDKLFEFPEQKQLDEKIAESLLRKFNEIE